MSPAPTTSRRTRKSLRVPMAARLTGRTAVAALVAALVMGILGMHALASHGAPAAPVTPSSTDIAGMASAHDAAMGSGDSHERHAHGVMAPEDATGASPGSRSGPGHDMSGMVMLCVVMLAAAALTLIMLLAAGFLRLVLPATFMPAAVRGGTLQWVRGTGPPHVWQFSVIRC